MYYQCIQCFLGYFLGNQTKTGNKVKSYGDHRIAMMLGIAGLLSEGTTVIEGAEHASVSYPNFWDEIDKNN